MKFNKRAGWIDLCCQPKNFLVFTKIFSWVLLMLAFGLSLLLWLSPVVGQVPGLSQSASSGQAIPPGVERIGLLEITGIELDGKELFKIASPAVLDRANPGAQVPVEVRAQQIEGNLNQLINSSLFNSQNTQFSTAPNPKTLEVYFNILNGQPVLFVKDVYLVEPKVLLTVTDADAQYHGVSKETLAAQWQKILEQELKLALERRQPDARRQHTLGALLFLAIALGATGLFVMLWRFLGQRSQALKRQQAEQDAIPVATGNLDPVATDTNQSLSLLERVRQRLSLQQRLQVLHLIRWLAFWAIAFVWISGISASLYRFPKTRKFAIGFVSTPILILVAWFMAGLINRLVNIGIDRVAKVWHEQELNTLQDVHRTTLRISTIVTVLKGLKTVLIYMIGVIWVVQILQIASTPLLAFGAILALAASFAAQSLVKDFVNGFLILLEDQYAIGDKIFVNNILGVVEDLNLRITQIRTDSGNLVTIPNSQISQVENTSRNWGRSDFRIEVAYDTNVDQALAIVQKVAEELSRDPEWQAFILNPNELLGVEEISHSGMVIRIWIRTTPLKDAAIARELRRRLKNEFDRNHIRIGTPQQLLDGHLVGQLSHN